MIDKETQRIVWNNLPKEFKEEVKKEYAKCVAIDMDDNPNLPAYAVESATSRRALLEMLFGEHNLTSDAEGEVMLTVPRKDIVELYHEVNKTISQCKGTELAIQAIGIKNVIWSFFGSKCLPDDVDSLDPKPAEPKYHVGQKVKIKGKNHGFEVAAIEKSDDCDEYKYKLAGWKHSYRESDLEPYTEPEEHIAENRKISQNIVDCDKCPKSVQKTPPDFGHSRLNIAAMAMQGILSNPKIMDSPGALDDERYIKLISFSIADAFLDECEKGGSK